MANKHHGTMERAVEMPWAVRGRGTARQIALQARRTGHAAGQVVALVKSGVGRTGRTLWQGVALINAGVSRIGHTVWQGVALTRAGVRQTGHALWQGVALIWTGASGAGHGVARSLASIKTRVKRIGRREPPTPWEISHTFYEGEVRLAMYPVPGLSQLLEFEDRLQALPEVRVLRSSGSRSKGSSIFILLENPVPLLDTLTRIPVVKGVMGELPRASTKELIVGLITKPLPRRRGKTVDKGVTVRLN